MNRLAGLAPALREESNHNHQHLLPKSLTGYVPGPVRVAVPAAIVVLIIPIVAGISMPIRFSISESGRGEDLEHNLIALSYRAFDLRPMADRAAVIMERQNAEGAAMGIDQYGNTYDKLARSTWKTRSGSGPPLAPQGNTSPIVTGFRTEVVEGGFDELVVRGHWPDVPWIKYHVDPERPNMPERNPVGIRPHGWQQLRVEFHNWVQEILDGSKGSGPSAPPTTGGGGGFPPSGGGPAAPRPASAAPPSRPATSSPTGSAPPIPTRATPKPATAAPDPDDDEMLDFSLTRPKQEASGTSPEPSYPNTPFDYGDAGESKVRDTIRAMFGPGMTPQRLAAAAGAPPDAINVSIHKSGFSGENAVDIYVNTPTSFLHRSVQANRGVAAGTRPTTIKNELFELVGSTPKGTGIGTEIFARQVEEAHAAGFTSMHTDAARDLGMNGYYTWPRVGYDAAIPREILVNAQRESEPTIKRAKRVSDLMATPEGRAWWKENGDSVEMTFDLAPGSYSRKTLDAYVKERGLRP